MRNLLLAIAFALGLGFAATGSQAAAVSNNVSAIQSSAKAGNSLVEKTHYRRRHWRHGRYWRYNRYYRPRHYRHHRYHRHHHRHHRHYRHHRHWR